MDMRKYGSGFVRAEDLHDGPREETIINVYVHEKYDCPVLEFESGDRVLVNNSSTRALNKAYGYQSEDWHGHTVSLSPESYLKDGETKETVKVTPISSRDGDGSNGSPQRIAPANLPAPVKRGVAEDLKDDLPY
jgi:hypothetical protein